MTQDEIIRMAKEAGIEADENNGYLEWWNFAKLVAANEREACAKVCDSNNKGQTNDPYIKGLIYGAGLCAADIRARSEK